ncbi:hypothetical protein [Mesorhizobium sp. KR9-304]|uniref:hypothetical protein n=1 Tax=Mesorhizobium sp. KR9-304 TaxID=3156614 RepID=UPI0032B463F4
MPQSDVSPTRRKLLIISLLSSILATLGKARASEPRFPDISAFRERVIARIKQLPDLDEVTPDPADPAKIDIRIKDNVITSDVTNIFGYLNSYPNENADEIIDRFVRSLTAFQTPVSHEQLVAAIRTAALLQEIEASGQSVLHQRLVGDLVIALMVDLPDSLRWAIEDDFPNESFDDLQPIAFENLREWLPKVAPNRISDTVVQYLVEGNDILAPGMILLDEFWQLAKSDFPGDVLVTIARRDQLIVFEASNPAALRAARSIVDDTFEEGFMLLSNRIYRRRDGKLELVEE